VARYAASLIPIIGRRRLVRISGVRRPLEIPRIADTDCARDGATPTPSNRSPRKTQPVSCSSAHKISDIEISSSRDSPRKSRPPARDARFSSPETGVLAANLRASRHFSERRKSLAGDHDGWLGRQDSNLGMAESKSREIAFSIKQRSENSSEFSALSINDLPLRSEHDPASNAVSPVPMIRWRDVQVHGIIAQTPPSDLGAP
jgi:hypothetical protein